MTTPLRGCFCPSCHNMDTLIVSEGFRPIVCVNETCPNPRAAQELLGRPQPVNRDADPLRMRIEETLRQVGQLAEDGLSDQKVHLVAQWVAQAVRDLESHLAGRMFADVMKRRSGGES